MTREDALSRANDCARQAAIATDRDIQVLWGGLRKLWLALAKFRDELGAGFDSEYARLQELQLSAPTSKVFH